jgi:hypothetical protein
MKAIGAVIAAGIALAALGGCQSGEREEAETGQEEGEGEESGGEESED